MEIMPCGNSTCSYLASQLDAVARQVAGMLTAKDHIMIVDLLRRGAHLAAMLHLRLIRDFKLENLSLIHLQVKRYADDLTLIHPEKS
jgi:pyrimidine operon attenuation protein/uracil phosphoribosyltransferase